ncbi:MAG: FAD-dependent 5-carboxymethylaminomethyl-2-thiouridine(34) oxidoreductase MnmC [Betaproteobacteria bacterium]|nr:FAD-dependent 5-carboxymethylaminomethyl-2-thiouridine(34) oxidoreductase MnmC [Betaproteobacteria bacterium]
MNKVKQAAIQQINGTVYSLEFDDIYHSSSGAREQAHTVFVSGNHLPERFAALKNNQFSIFETGFGVGVNFLATAQCWCENRSNDQAHLHYVACEKFPVSSSDLNHIIQEYVFPENITKQLINQWPSLTTGYHEIRFNKESITLTLIFDDIRSATNNLTMSIDALFLDGFSPKKNPDMWQEDILMTLAKHCHAKTTLATWCVAGSVREGLTKAGFNLTREKGFGQKKHRLVGQFDRIPEDKQAIRQERYFPHISRYLKQSSVKQVGVVGGGIAGSLLTYVLTQSQINVTLFERGSHIANAASGNPAGILRPVVSKDDNILSRITRRGFFLTKQLIKELEYHSSELIAHYPGVIHLAKDHTEQITQQDIVKTRHFPTDYVTYLTGEEIKTRFQIDHPLGGLFFTQAGFINPQRLCERAIHLSSQRLTLHLNTEIQQIKQQNDKWLVFNANNEQIGEFDSLVLCLGANNLSVTEKLGLTINRGQLSLFNHPHLTAALPVLCKDGYIITLPNNQVLSGATYDHELDPNPTITNHEKNQQRLLAILGKNPLAFNSVLDRIAYRSVSRDRLPVVGELSQKGLYCIMGNASRGIVWSVLNARIIRSLITGEPQPIEKTLLDNLSPQRLFSRHI